VHSYRVSGLSVLSEIVLPGLVITRPAPGATDVTVRCGPVPLILANAAQTGPTWEMVGDRLLLRVPGVARFLLRAGREIVFEPEDGVPADAAAVFLTGTVFGILLHQRERIVLHASAVRVGNKAVLFCGSSGAGKSTLAAALVQRGFPLLVDDFCAIGPDPTGAPVAHSDGRQLKLWAQAIEHLDLVDRRGAAVRSKFEKFYVKPHASCAQALPLGAVYVLRETRPPLHDGIEQPNIVDAAIFIRQNAYRPRLVVAMGQKAQYFRAAATIASNAGIFLLTRPFDFASMSDVVGGLEAHWRQIELR
jgi:hypothetical protein